MWTSSAEKAAAIPILFMVVFTIVLSRTTWGRHLYAIGGNATRGRRPSEIDGRHYTFIDRAAFEDLRARDDLPYVGLIGSQTKWATFRHRLEVRGFTEAELARVTCPIGVPGIGGKEPEVIAL